MSQYCHLKKIISGGQTGVDQAALLAAHVLELQTGGWAPQGWLTEEGPQEEFMRRMGLVECLRPGYPARTEQNVRDSQGTLIISLDRQPEGGTYDTVCVCDSMDKPVYYVWPIVAPQGQRQWTYVIDGYKSYSNGGSRIDLRSWININGIQVLNVAGPRYSKWPGGLRWAYEWIIESL